MAANDFYSLIDRYLYAVSRYLPAQRHDDLLTELAANLHSEMEDKAAALGRCSPKTSRPTYCAATAIPSWSPRAISHTAHSSGRRSFPSLVHRQTRPAAGHRHMAARHRSHRHLRPTEHADRTAHRRRPCHHRTLRRGLSIPRLGHRRLRSPGIFQGPRPRRARSSQVGPAQTTQGTSRFRTTVRATPTPTLSPAPSSSCGRSPSRAFPY